MSIYATQLNRYKNHMSLLLATSGRHSPGPAFGSIKVTKNLNLLYHWHDQQLWTGWSQWTFRSVRGSPSPVQVGVLSGILLWLSHVTWLKLEFWHSELAVVTPSSCQLNDLKSQPLLLSSRLMFHKTHSIRVCKVLCPMAVVLSYITLPQTWAQSTMLFFAAEWLQYHWINLRSLCIKNWLVFELSNTLEQIFFHQKGGI